MIEFILLTILLLFVLFFLMKFVKKYFTYVPKKEPEGWEDFVKKVRKD